MLIVIIVQDVVPRMAEAVQGMKSSGGLVVNGKDQMNKAIQYILDRLYMARISIRMLIAQHQSLYCPFESTKTKHAPRLRSLSSCRSQQAAAPGPAQGWQ